MKRLKDGIGWVLALALIALLPAGSFASPSDSKKAESKVVVKAEQTAHFDVIELQNSPALELTTPQAVATVYVDLVEDERPAAIAASYREKLRGTSTSRTAKNNLYNGRSRDKPSV